MLLASRVDDILGHGLLLVCVLTAEEIIKYDNFRTEVQAPQPKIVDDDDDVEVAKFKRQIEEVENETDLYKKQVQADKEQYKSIRAFIRSYCPSSCESDLIALINMVGQFFSVVITQVGDHRNKYELINIDSIIFKYCGTNNLLFSSMKEIYYNLSQLLDILQNIINNDIEISQLNQLLRNYSQPSTLQIQKLTSVFLQASKFHQICRMQQYYEPERNIQIKYYQSQQSSEKYTIHPTSVLYGQWRDFVVYTHMMEIGNQIKKSYLFNVTAVSDLAVVYQLDQRSDEEKRLKFDEQRVWYDASNDKIYSMASAVVGNGWDINNFKHSLPTNYLGYYRLFAQLLLKGEIVEFFKSMSKTYKYSISTIKETNMQQYSQAFIMALRSNQVSNKRTLMAAWKRDPLFLHNEITLITHQQYHSNIRKRWPPI